MAKKALIDLRFVLGLTGGKAVLGFGVLSVGTFAWHRYTTPPPVYMPGLTVSELRYFRVDAADHDTDGIRYRSEPKLHSSIAGMYPANGTIIIAKEAEQIPNWVLLSSGYWLPLEVEGKPCMQRLNPTKGSEDEKAVKAFLNI